MSRPKLLDLFCCQGGASEGYRRAGFDVYGVELDPVIARRYPFPVHIGDALDVLWRLLAGESIDFTHPSGEVEWLTEEKFVAKHASPPCQAYSVTRHSHDVEYPELVDPVREAFKRGRQPWVIENVVGAPMVDPLLLCGSMFDLSAEDEDGTPLVLRRHRLFESSVWLAGPGTPCVHDDRQVAGVYGGGRSQRSKDGAKWGARGGYTPSKSVRADLMGMPWATLKGLSEAIPPAYTEFIGVQLIEHLAVAA